ncbi:DUF4864 domain-containing protein [Alsobacter sp. R-9]
MARRDAILWTAAAAALALVQPVAARADDAVRAVIEDQLKAFLGDDGPRAWSHASPGIQTMFRTTDNFMAMVRQGYQPVYRPKAWSFGPLRDTPAGPEQEVRITDTAGEDWLAVYTMERQPDGSWKIAGCRLLKAPPPTT